MGVVMAKQGMKRPGADEVGNKRPKNDVAPVPEIKGKAKSGKAKVEKSNKANQFSNEAAIWQDERRDSPGGDYS